MGKKEERQLIRLMSKDGKELARTTLSVSSRDWRKQTAVLKAVEDADSALLAISPQVEGKYALVMFLFPQKTFKGHKNGFVLSLAQAIADIHPRFVRFPGGCACTW